MASEKNKLDPTTAESVQKAAAKAKKEALSRKTLEALLNTAPEQLISHNPNAEVVKGNANESGCWVHSPAMVEMFAAADRRLTQVAEWDGIQVKQVDKVHAHLVPNTKLVVIKAADPGDTTALPVNRYGSSVWINLITLLGAAKLTVKTGYRERFDVNYIPPESPLWPGLLFDLSLVKERRVESKRKTAPDAGEAGDDKESTAV